MDKEYKSFKQFYPFYLSEHMNPICRGLHFIGTLCVIGIIIFSFTNIKALFINYKQILTWSRCMIRNLILVFFKMDSNSSFNSS